MSMRQHHFHWTDGGDGVQWEITTETPEAGIELVHIRISLENPDIPPCIQLTWEHPAADIQGVWHPNCGRNRGFVPDWGAGYTSRLTNSSPVVCLFSGTGRNKLTFAFSDALNPIVMKAGVHEETAEYHCAVTLFDEPVAPLSHYEATLRVDCRDLFYYEALNEVQNWWSGLPGLTPAPVPDSAREPMYSTWYSYHQQLVPEEIEEQCRLAKKLGCESVIVDDGWQTADNLRGYAYCGDWNVCPDKIPNMKEHVERVHRLGMKYLLWYSVPFVGMHSRAWNQFQDKMLYTIEERGWGIVDPRYPEVREYLILIYEKALIEWDLDGFKLDFMDSFLPPGGRKPEYGNGRDYVSVSEAVDRLMTDIMQRLRRIKPKVMIEFRQSYIGPHMRKYGNMFRASDCPNDSIENRVRTLDIRLLCGNTAAHADPIMWSMEEPAESAALQLINALFAVPQISVRLDQLPERHQDMAAFWLSFWREHRQVLLDGPLEPYHPELLYPIVIAAAKDILIAAAYERTVVPLNRELPKTVVLINGTRENGMIVEWAANAGSRAVTVQDTTGRVMQEYNLGIEGVQQISVPPAGLVTLIAGK